MPTARKGFVVSIVWSTSLAVPCASSIYARDLRPSHGGIRLPQDRGDTRVESIRRWAGLESHNLGSTESILWPEANLDCITSLLCDLGYAVCSSIKHPDSARCTFYQWLRRRCFLVRRWWNGERFLLERSVDMGRRPMAHDNHIRTRDIPSCPAA